jgi:hypothetical protein
MRISGEVEVFFFLVLLNTFQTTLRDLISVQCHKKRERFTNRSEREISCRLSIDTGENLTEGVRGNVCNWKSCVQVHVRFAEAASEHTVKVRLRAEYSLEKTKTAPSAIKLSS